MQNAGLFQNNLYYTYWIIIDYYCVHHFDVAFDTGGVNPNYFIYCW